ncbi:aminotransferase class I/II-fold pyridoxal phosphate-dependent enzyme [Phreatobacter aquaticus]|uniref:Aminotransferase class I/II-fold pyridoxal phosphate-dependent enzyme n=1 Tax=Phreatobacter aquaticus TaxID=2570229 RepID=A0A4D7QHF7_9HYPH|nr:aminotransferase class I/II-fold pyridoxal phosphate-dependent enzyme [Phreatobacter aquaticus]QCK84866.1 aminotransferase class I/II-fold pyridoxal phosphate-dependent enzyme [Phreatobacter aquaticus]
MTQSKPSGLQPRTLAAQALGWEEPETHGVVTPIHVATTYIRDPDNQYRNGFVYGRPDNQTVKQAEAVLAMLEEGKEAMVLGSGMSAATAVIMALPAGAHIIAPTIMYWALRNWLMNDAPTYGYTTSFVDTADLAAVKAAVQPGKTKLIWLETPSNPLWTLADIAAISEIAHAAGAICAVDSTVATPVFTRPLTLGADIVMHAATKYLNGHSDVVAGALVTREANDFWAKVRRVRSMHGQILGPFEAFLLMRGMRTLHVRAEAQAKAALSLAEKLKAHPLVADVLYPGLTTHPQHALAVRQMQGGFSGMLSIRVKAGEQAAVSTAARVAVWKRATSLGGVESLIEHRASIEGAGSPCPTDLLRLSVGIEAVDDLYADIDRALRGAND